MQYCKCIFQFGSVYCKHNYCVLHILSRRYDKVRKVRMIMLYTRILPQVVCGSIPELSV